MIPEQFQTIVTLLRVVIFVGVSLLCALAFIAGRVLDKLNAIAMSLELF